MNKIYESVTKKISNSILFNEYVYFKKKYQNSIVVIDTGIFEAGEMSDDLTENYPFLNNLLPKQLKSMNALELERLIIKTICNYLDFIFRNNIDENGNTISYREARKNIEKDFREIISFIFALKNEKTIPTFKSFFNSDDKYYHVISRLKSNGVLTNDNQFKNSSATYIAILICKLFDLGYLKNIEGKKLPIYNAMKESFRLDFGHTHFSNVIKLFFDNGLLTDIKHKETFKSLDFLTLKEL